MIVLVEIVEFGGDGWVWWIEMPELSVAVVSERIISDSALPVIVASTLVARLRLAGWEIRVIEGQWGEVGCWIDEDLDKVVAKRTDGLTD